MSAESDELDYLSNIFESLLGFKGNKLSIGDLAIEIPSAKDAILLSIYAKIPFLTGRYEGIRLVDPLGTRGPLVKVFMDDEWGSVQTPFPIGYSSLRQDFPRIFEGKKFLVLARFRTNSASEKYLRRLKREKIRSIFDQVERSNIPYESFLLEIFPLSYTSRGKKEFYIPENFFEYFAGIVLKRMGYLVTPSLMGGDLDAFLIPKLTEANEGRGCFLAEIALDDKLKRKVREFELSEGDVKEVVTIEVESSPERTRSYSPNAGFGQLKKYLVDYDKGLVAGPLCFEEGALSFYEDGRLFFKGFKPGGISDPKLKKGIVHLLREVSRLA